MTLRNRLACLGAVCLLPAFAAAALACGGGAGDGASASQLTGPVQPAYAYDPNAITVTGAENFYADLLHQIGGSNLKIYTLLRDPNADPHQYESNAGDARAVADSRLVIENGFGSAAFIHYLFATPPD